MIIWNIDSWSRDKLLKLLSILTACCSQVGCFLTDLNTFICGLRMGHELTPRQEALPQRGLGTFRDHRHCLRSSSLQLVTALQKAPYQTGPRGQETSASALTPLILYPHHSQANKITPLLAYNSLTGLY